MINKRYVIAVGEKWTIGEGKNCFTAFMSSSPELGNPHFSQCEFYELPPGDPVSCKLKEKS